MRTPSLVISIKVQASKLLVHRIESEDSKDSPIKEKGVSQRKLSKKCQLLNKILGTQCPKWVLQYKSKQAAKPKRQGRTLVNFVNKEN